MTKIYKNNLKDIKPFTNTFIVHKSAKKGSKSFRITQQLLQSIYNKAQKINKLAEIVLSVPANKTEKYILHCSVTKEKI